MKSATFYVVLGARRNRYSPNAISEIRAERLTQRSPSLDGDELAVRVKITLDEGLFRSLLDAGELVINSDQVAQPAIEQVDLPEVEPDGA